jgi:hypothetical protein
MWTIAEYEGVTLFSLKQSSATASGGKTLLVPTPFAIKMALLDVACRIRGVFSAEDDWPRIRDLRIALRPAEHIVVTNLFQKVLKPRRAQAKPNAPDAGPFQRTIGYREYAQWVGMLGIALGNSDLGGENFLTDLLLNVNYLGKRGGFVQLIPPLIRADEPPAGFVEATADQTAFAMNGTLQVLDDCTPDLTFAKANVYTAEKIRLGKERVTRHIVLSNYRLTRSSKSFTLYERAE